MPLAAYLSFCPIILAYVVLTLSQIIVTEFSEDIPLSSNSLSVIIPNSPVSVQDTTSVTTELTHFHKMVI